MNVIYYLLYNHNKIRLLFGNNNYNDIYDNYYFERHYSLKINSVFITCDIY
jgi:hypothetical protein